MMGELNGDEFSVEYDCSSNLFGTNYCVHILARKPSMEKETLTHILNKIDDLNLNQFDLDLEKTRHEGCWDKTDTTAIEFLQ